METTLILQIICVTLVHLSNAEIYTSLSEGDVLRKTYEGVIAGLEDYLVSENERLRKVKKTLNVFKNEYAKMEDVNHYLGNPMNFFRTIKILTADLDYVEHLTNNITTKFERNPALVYPDDEDLTGAVVGVHRVQIVYALNTTELANGVLTGTYSHGRKLFVEHMSPASASDCYVIGNVLNSLKKYRRAAEWLLEALSKFRDRAQDDALTKAVIVRKIRDNYIELEDIKKAMQWTERLHELNEELKSHDLEMTLIDKMKQHMANSSYTDIDYEGYKEEDDPDVAKYFPRLCQGESEVPIDVQKKLVCYYLNGPHPFLKIAPIKSEMLLDDPEIMIFHEVLYDNEIQLFRTMATPFLKRGQVTDPVTGVTEIADYRITKSTWLFDDDFDEVEKLSQRVSDFTNLDKESSEALLVANYGLGGHYEAHFDFLRKAFFENPDTEELEYREFGNRVATVLLYMTDVEQGGGTAFVDVGVSVFPIKGSAVVFWDLHRSGETDFRTRHSACPVMRGSKWICNKWMRERGQEFIRPCTLEYQSTEHLPFSKY